MSHHGFHARPLLFLLLATLHVFQVLPSLVKRLQEGVEDPEELIRLPVHLLLSEVLQRLGELRREQRSTSETTSFRTPKDRIKANSWGTEEKKKETKTEERWNVTSERLNALLDFFSFLEFLILLQYASCNGFCFHFSGLEMSCCKGHWATRQLLRVGVVVWGKVTKMKYIFIYEKKKVILLLGEWSVNPTIRLKYWINENKTELHSVQNVTHDILLPCS